MKTAKTLMTFVFGLLLARQCNPQRARDLFNELYKGGSLDTKADEYVCFDDRTDHKAFFIYAEYSTLRQSLMEKPEFEKLSKAQQGILNKGFLIVRTYDHGVPHTEEDLFYRDEGSWVTDPFTIHSLKTKMRMRIQIAPGTARYLQKVEILDSASKTVNELFAYGHCELVPTDIEQNGN